MAWDMTRHMRDRCLLSVRGSPQISEHSSMEGIEACGFESKLKIRAQAGCQGNLCKHARCVITNHGNSTHSGMSCGCPRHIGFKKVFLILRGK